ncbi:unnamed protein product [Cuscuta campestris]|uniref:RRM domain-containing protein n=1 Tax=Cuscuta campestris TaxID=132261 RepID=A0A484NH41_9ASTE|nr:unnamed protein product [Cuscuta campestris]
MPTSSTIHSAETTDLSGKRKREPKYERETDWTLKKPKERSEEDKDTTQGLADNLLPEVEGRVELLETKSEANLIPVMFNSFSPYGLANTLGCQIQGAASRKKTLIIDNLSSQARIPNMQVAPLISSFVLGARFSLLTFYHPFYSIKFFKDVGKVVNVRRIVNSIGKYLGSGSVEFASPNEAKKALEKKNGENLCGTNITLRLAKTTHNPQRPGNMFFKDVGKVYSVRLIVNHEGKHVGCGFVDFASANSAKKALEKKNGEYLHAHKIFLDEAKTAPCSPRQKYSPVEKLCINFFRDVVEVVHVRLSVNRKGMLVGFGFVEFASADEAKKAQEKKNGENLCGKPITLSEVTVAPYPPKNMYEDYLRGESLLIEEDEAVEGLDEFVEEVSSRKRTLFVENLPPKCKIRHIANFFHDFGEVSVRLLVDYQGKHLRCGFLKFASDIEAKKVRVVL